MTDAVIIPEEVLILPDLPWNSSFLILIVFVMWDFFFDDDSNSNPGTVVGMHSAINVKSTQFDVWFSGKVCLRDKT